MVVERRRRVLRERSTPRRDDELAVRQRKVERGAAFLAADPDAALQRGDENDCSAQRGGEAQTILRGPRDGVAAVGAQPRRATAAGWHRRAFCLRQYLHHNRKHVLRISSSVDGVK